MTAASAWETTLRAEHAAIYGFGIVGGRLGPEDEQSLASIQQHRARRDHCAEQLVALGEVPEPAAAAYEPQVPVESKRAARVFAADIEDDCMAAYAALVAETDGQGRRIASRWLTESTFAIGSWAGVVPALPGLQPS